MFRSITVAVLSFLLAFTGAALPQAREAPREHWGWPTEQVAPVSRAFDPPEIPWGPGHRGVDLDVPVGSPVFACADGVVIYAGMLVDREVISIQHADGLRSTYEPVAPLVSKGQNVARGEQIGTLNPGHSPNGLHWGAKRGSADYVDPLRLVLGPPVLKPWR